MEHRAEIEEVKDQFRVEYNGEVLAESNRALELQEYHPNYNFAPVYYLPEDALNMQLFSKNDHNTTCPIKGTASYLDLKSDNAELENIAWTYPEPTDESADLKGHYAFDMSKKVELYKNGKKVTEWGIRKK